MNAFLYRLLRDLHLYLGLFVSPFIVVFSLSVFYLVHSSLFPSSSVPPVRRSVTGLLLPDRLEDLSGRPLIDALKPVLTQAGVEGEVGFVRHIPKEHRFVVPVTVPGRETTVTIDAARREASVEQRVTGLADALVVLHKSPGPHLVSIRKNWIFMRVWHWLADATVYLLLFLSASGIYLWAVLRAERIAGLCLLAAGAMSFFGIVYALCH